MRFLTREEADIAHANGAFIAGGDTFLPRWQTKAAAFRAAMGPRARLDLPYGDAERQRFDLFVPEGAAKGLLVFVHGGYWIESDRKGWSHLAAGALARGWACAMPSYSLAPQARIAAMTVEIVRAIRTAIAMVPGPVVVAGHSAGGHLSARMGCADIDLDHLARVVPIAPVADLEPLLETAMQDDLLLDADEVAAESPARLPLRAGIAAHVWVGGQERPLFLWQARLLSERWGCAWTVDPGRHHFDVIDGLEEAQSPLMQACLNGLG